MVSRDIKRIKEYEQIWKQTHGEPKFSDVRWEGAKRRQQSQLKPIDI